MNTVQYPSYEVKRVGKRNFDLQKYTETFMDGRSEQQGSVKKMVTKKLRSLNR